jgi:hemerythrin
MTIMAWSNMLSVGVRSIDDQHRVLVGILNRLGGSASGDAAGDEMGVLPDLIDYTKTHFAHEEELMRGIGYRGLAAHEKEHRELFDAVAERMARCEAGQHAGHDDLVLFLRDWLTHHIMGTDRALGRALNQAGVR